MTPSREQDPATPEVAPERASDARRRAPATGRAHRRAIDVARGYAREAAGARPGVDAHGPAGRDHRGASRSGAYALRDEGRAHADAETRRLRPAPYGAEAVRTTISAASAFSMLIMRALMRAFHRSAFTWIALLGIVFAQLAVAAYACPSSVPESEQTLAISDASGLPCPEMAAQMPAGFDPAQPGLCNQHCAQDGQSAEVRSLAALHPTFVVAFVLPASDSSAFAGAGHAQQPELLRPPALPPLWRSRRLRI